MFLLGGDAVSRKKPWIPRLQWMISGVVALAMWAPALPARAAIFADGLIDVLASPPPSVLKDALASDDKITGFVERENFTLPTDVQVDFTEPGVYDSVATLPATRPRIPAGTVVSSFFVHSDQARDAHQGRAILSVLKFDTDILGVIILKD